MSPTETIVAVGVFVGVGVLILCAKKIKVVGTPVCTLEQIPDVFERLKQQGKNASFAVFMFQPPGKSNPDDAVNIQFSIEDGHIGLDWCLLGSTNISDKDKLQRFITEQGYKAESKELNRVKYLRVEQGDLPRLCQNVITKLYGMGRDVELDMVVEGFSWP